MGGHRTDSINLTFVEISTTRDPPQTIRAAGEVSEDGQSFTAEFTIEFTGEGAPTGEYGPGHVTGTRINVEPIGTPAGSLEDLFAQFEEGTAPAGTAPTETTPTGTEPVDTAPGPNRGHRAGRHRTGRYNAGRHSGGNHDGLIPARVGAQPASAESHRWAVTGRTGANGTGSRLMSAPALVRPDVQESIRPHDDAPR